jgi:hypothetical protein
VGAPTAAAALPDATALTGTVTPTVGAVQQQASGAVTGVQQTAQQVGSQANQTVSRATADVQRALPKVHAPKNPASGVHVEAPAVRVDSPAAAVETPAVQVQTPAVKAPAVKAPDLPSPPTDGDAKPLDLAPVSDLTRGVLNGLQNIAPVNDLTTLLNGTLRQLAPVGGLLAPVGPLFAGGPVQGRLADLPELIALVPAPRDGAPIALRGVLGATATGPSATPPAGPTSRVFQAASATPPAAEVGGRPVSPPPWTAPAPVAGGATAVFSGGSVFVPFLGLLVLAALVVPRLMRRLDELPAFVRPEPFLCALERPG